MKKPLWTLTLHFLIFCCGFRILVSADSLEMYTSQISGLPALDYHAHGYRKGQTSKDFFLPQSLFCHHSISQEDFLMGSLSKNFQFPEKNSSCISCPKNSVMKFLTQFSASIPFRKKAESKKFSFASHTSSNQLVFSKYLKSQRHMGINYFLTQDISILTGPVIYKNNQSSQPRIWAMKMELSLPITLE